MLIDCTSGALVEVDFDCLFDKGLELATPERVPFRLTQNMIDAFGVLGLEGNFRRACEVTMSVIRENRDLLFNVLQSFVNDPLVEWEKASPAQQPLATTVTSKSSAASAAGGATTLEANAQKAAALLAMQEQALLHMHKIEQRLRGIVGREAAPLSIRRQVDHLLVEATSKANLARMYVGWMPWL